MCGIVGALSFNNSEFVISKSYLTDMRDAMIHRGPDDAGEWISPDKKMGLGHRRLSIIDLSKSASQPMCNDKNNLSISLVSTEDSLEPIDSLEQVDSPELINSPEQAEQRQDPAATSEETFSYWIS